MLLRCLLFIALLLPLSALAWPSFPHAPGIEIEWVSEKMIYNGLPMKVESFKCDCDAEQVLEYYRKNWGRKKRGYIEQPLGEFTQLIRGDKKYLYTVMVKPNPSNFDASVGRLTISDIPGDEQERYVMGEGVPSNGDVSVVSDVYDAVPGKKSRTVLMMSPYGVNENMQFYYNYYISRGWKSYLKPMNDNMGVQALSFSHKKKDTNIVINEAGLGSSILFNEIEETY